MSLWQFLTGLSLLFCLTSIVSVYVLMSRMARKHTEERVREGPAKPVYTVPIPDGTYETVHDYDEYYTKTK